MIRYEDRILEIKCTVPVIVCDLCSKERDFVIERIDQSDAKGTAPYHVSGYGVPRGWGTWNGKDVCVDCHDKIAAAVKELTP